MPMNNMLTFVKDTSFDFFPAVTIAFSLKVILCELCFPFSISFDISLDRVQSRGSIIIYHVAVSHPWHLFEPDIDYH